MNRMRFAIAVIVAGAGAGIMYSTVPWSPALLAAAALVATAASKSKRDAVKVVLANAAALCVALAAFEGYLGYRDSLGDGTVMEGSITEGFTHADDVLGYAPDHGTRVTARKRYGETVVYDVVYTIGANGLRVTPAATASGTDECIFFFGDSVTFGEGVNDDEAFPFLVAKKLDEGRTTHNFAFSGYGPHQMLAALLAGAPGKTVKCRPVRFVYLAILEHIGRVAGLAPWDRHGPRFDLDANGMAVQDGNFDSPPRLLGRWTAVDWLRIAANNSHTLQKFFGQGRDPRSAELALFLGIVTQSARVARSRYPGSSFHVLLWDGRDDPRIDVIYGKLTASGIPVHRLTAVIPDFVAHSSRYLLGPQDGHPNPLMHKLLAEYLARNIMER